MEDALLPIAIHGATSVAVAVRLQNVLATLEQSACPENRAAIRRVARESLDRSIAGLSHAPDNDRVRAAAGVDGKE